MKLRKQYAVVVSLSVFLLVWAGCGDDGNAGTLPETLEDAPQGDQGDPADGVVPILQCTAHADCAALEGADACRTPLCDFVGGQCTLFKKPNCCTNDADCDDGDPVTVDTCDAAINACKYDDQSKPCSVDADCAVNEPCVTFECATTCVTWQKPDCCAGAADCEDGDSCTQDSCENFSCAYSAAKDPLCCGDVLFGETFDSAIPPAFTVDDNGKAVVWHYSTERARSPDGSARFADPVAGHYGNAVEENEFPASVGALITPEFALPADQAATLSFWLYLDLEQLENYDLFFVEVLSDQNSIPTIWDKTEVAPEQYGTWIQATADLSAFAGHTIKLAFKVDTIDGTVNNKGEGVYVDDLAIVTGCITGCVSDAECDDGNPCTDNQCNDSGTCDTAQLDDCCQSVDDCGAPPPDGCTQLNGCINNVCQYQSTGACCQGPADCDDGNSCTLDECLPMGCINSSIPDCCEPVALLTNNFDDGNVSVEINNDQDAGGWTVHGQLQTHDRSPAALHFGDADGAGYGFGGSASGEARLSALDGSNAQVELSFWTYVDVEAFPDADAFQVAVRSAGGDPFVVWSKDELGPDQYQSWVHIVRTLPKDLTFGPFQVIFRFNTIDDIENETLGVFVDTVTLSVVCEDVGCTADSQCNDDNPCTGDFCVDGACENVLIPGCQLPCNSDIDCTTADPCLIGGCDADGVCVFKLSPNCPPQCGSDDECQDDDPCTQDLCADDGLCLHLPTPDCGGECMDAGQCDDNQECTSDFCFGGQCQNIPIPGCMGQCDQNVACNDNNDCTVDLCTGGLCENVPIPNCLGECEGAAECDDDDECTSDFCVMGQCQSLNIPGCGDNCGSTAECNDGDVCTQDACILKKCIHEPIANCGGGCMGAADCNDNDVCTSDLCVQGQCQSLGIPGCGGCMGAADCNDNDVCTSDFCVQGQCQNLQIPGCGGGCTSSADCNDNQVCTSDFCIQGACQNLQIPGCQEPCDGDLGCADDDPCTNDLCGAQGNCLHQPIPGCGEECFFPEQCQDGDDCTTNTCQNGQCEFLPIPGCGDLCMTAAECSDGVSCSADSCVNGQCQNTVIPGCLECQSGPVFADAFNDNNSGWEFSQAIENVGWQIAKLEQALSPPAALYYGNPEAFNYAAETPTQGTAISPPFLVPQTALSVTLNTALWLDIEGMPAFDELEIRVVSGDGDSSLVWTKEQTTTGPEWNVISVGLNQYAGQVIRLQFIFATNDTLFNDSTGIMVDDLSVDVTCAGECDPAACADDNPCTQDGCSVNGTCTNAPILGCCTGNDACADSNVCTTDLCVGNGCVHLPIPGCGNNDCDTHQDCADDNPCTENICTQGQCVTADIQGCCTGAAQCADNDECTADLCIENTCQNLPIPGCNGGCQGPQDCNDGNVCTGDLCIQGQCVNPPQPDCCQSDDACDDGNPCTKGACGPDGQCGFEAIADCCTNGSQCGDMNPCTADFCQNNVCIHPEEPGCCTSDAECDDDNQCTSSSCIGLSCITFTIQGCCLNDESCDDGSVCTVDSCDAGKCVSKPDDSQLGCCTSAADCEDGNACTSHTCSGNVCTSTAVPSCCTNNPQCADANACTSDSCQDHTCVNTPQPDCCSADSDCNDSVGCTTDSCDTATGTCVNVKTNGCCTKNSDCIDDDVCTVDSCSQSACKNTAITGCCEVPTDCAAGECGVATCIANQCGVMSSPGCCSASDQCDDGDDCTADTCANGACVAEAIPNCCPGAATLDDQAFDASGSFPAGWLQVGNGQAPKWQISTLQAHSGGNSVWFGNAATGDFTTGNDQESAGTVRGPKLLLPTGINILATFWVWLDVEQLEGFDQVFMRVHDQAAGTETVVWDKSAVLATLYQSWVKVSVDLTQWGGRSVILSWRLASVDEQINNTQGVFVDDVRVVSTCEELNFCVFDNQCDDGQPCTADTCVAGTCSFSEVDNCCLSAAECDDAHPCTDDACLDGQCIHDAKEGCCAFDAECNDGNPCTADGCQNNGCSNTPVGDNGCCAADVDCQDDNPCTQGFCVASQCHFEADTGPNCCSEQDLLEARFDDGTSSGFTLINGGTGAEWHVSQQRFFSPPFSLRFGIPGEDTYSTQPGGSGQAISPAITVPLTAEEALMTFRVYLDTGQDGGPFSGATVQLAVLNGQTLKTHWTTDDVNTQHDWLQPTVDLTEYKGQTVQIYLLFQQSNTPFGGGDGEGAYVDNLHAFTTCQ